MIAPWHADPAWQRIDLLSDVHLHAGAPGTFAAWRDHLLNTPANAVLMLGDLFEAWVGDDARHHGFERECLAVLQQASRRAALGFMQGNRDFLLGQAMCAEAGMKALPDPTLAQAFGQTLLLSHGDALCLADTEYQTFRRQVRDAAWQADFLALPLAERRQRARAMRDASQMHQAATGPAHWIDIDASVAIDLLRQAGASTLVHGHTHRPARHALDAYYTRHVLGDWEFDRAPHRARILVWTDAGLTPQDLARP